MSVFEDGVVGEIRILQALDKESLSCKSIPEGWMLCDGRALSPSEHNELRRLLKVMGSPYGEDIEGNPRIPNIQGRGYHVIMKGSS